MGFLKGCATALITPFSGAGVNFDVLGELINFQIAGGVDALVLLGTTGEPSTMREDEKDAVIDFSRKRIAGRVKLIVGTGSNSTERAVECAKRAENLGADGILAVTPYYNKCTQAGLIAYYRTICEAVDLPVIAYNVPSRTGVNLLPQTANRIAEFPNLAGIKEACGDMAQIMETARLIRGKCDLYSGDDALNLPILCTGGTAVISVVSNLAPKGVKALVCAVERADLVEANRLSDALSPLVKACFSEVNPIPVKAGVNLLGYRAGAPRAPLTELEPEHLALLKNAMIEYGLEVKA